MPGARSSSEGGALAKQKLSGPPANGARKSHGAPRSSPGALDRLPDLLENIPVPLAVVADDGRFVAVNAELAHLTGRPRDALREGSLSDVVAADDVPALSRACASAAGGERAAVEVRFPRPDDETVRARLDLAPVERPRQRRSVLVAATDVSAVEKLEAALAESESRRARVDAERRKETSALRDSERRLRFALDAARMGTWSWDPVRDVATHDTSALEILGGKAGDFTLASAMHHHLPADGEERYASCLRRILDPASADRRFLTELPWRRPDGEWIWIEITGEAHFEGEGEARRATEVTGTILDITDRKRSEEGVAEAGRQKDRFLATLAHELRNPLAPLCYAAELLDAETSEERDWARAVIERQVSHMTRLIDDLLDISRITRDQLEVRKELVSIGDIVAAAVEASRPTLKEHGQELVVQLPGDAVHVRGDLVRLTQVVTNLLKNAAKFTSEPGRVWLTVEREPPWVSIMVRDAGIGISPDELPHLFDMFYQSTRTVGRAQGGLGVGLYLVRRLVELHGGRVEARSQGAERGADFVVRLPLAPAPGDRPPRSALRQAGTAGRRVLVVDDNHDSADALAKLLRVGGNEVETAYDGSAAIDTAARFRPEVVILDLGMPTVDGYEVCRRIREQPWGKDVHMIALTGWGRVEDRVRTREAGFDDHLVKPVSLGDVSSLLARPAAR
ncbi:MAG TPA: ATP-binding protein [Gammaproteobacteria bacterium]